MSTVLDEVTSEATDATHIRRRVDDWEERLNGLYATIGDRLPDGWVARRGAPVLMHEKLMRKFGVPPKPMPTLELHNRTGQFVKLEPHALWIIGNNGRVDVRRDGRRFLIVDAADNFEGTGLAGGSRRPAAPPRVRHARLADTVPGVSDLQAIAESYQRIDSYLGDLRDSCDAAGEADKRDRVAREQELNDQAYFVLAWGQLETDIDQACRAAAGPREGQRRIKRTVQLYSVRNQIAHGTLLSERIDVSSEIQDFFRIRSSLARE